MSGYVSDEGWCIDVLTWPAKDLYRKGRQSATILSKEHFANSLDVILSG